MSKNYGTLQDKNGNSLFPVGVETITNSNGTALKFADGTMICTKIVTWTGSISNSWGSLYDSDTITLGSFAQSFIELPVVNVSQVGAAGAMIECVVNPSKTSFGSIWLCRPNVASSYTYNLHCMAIGRWK